MKLSNTITQVIALATEIDEYWLDQLPKRVATFPFINCNSDLGPPPPQQEELRALLTALPAATIFELALIMYIGRGDLEPDNLLAEYQEVSDRFGKPTAAIQHMMGKAPLGRYLSEGLAYLSRAKIDVDRLFE